MTSRRIMGFRCLTQFSKFYSSFAAKFGTMAAASLQHAPKPLMAECDDEYAELDWDNLGFSLVPTDYMFVKKYSGDRTFEQGCVSHYENIKISPAAGVLNYGQGLLEGTKAVRREDGGLLLFRPDENAIRMKAGAERMCMPSPSVEQFVDAVKQTVLANKRWVPPPGKGSLYIRPLLFGNGPILGLSPTNEYTFLVYGSPVQNYFKEGTATLNLYVEEEVARAFQGGTGCVKTIVNYSPVFEAVRRAKDRGFSDVLYLDAEARKNVEEASASNVFLVKGNTIATPATSGTILAGITRKSIIEIAQDLGYKVEERRVSVDELQEADEVFCTGTAVGVASVGSITYRSTRTEYRSGHGSVAQELRSILVGTQTGLIADTRGWVLEIE